MQRDIITQAIAAGQAKTARSAARTLILAAMAGAFVSIGGTLSILLGSGCPALSADNPAIGRLLSGLAFPVGLFLIVMFGGELFTGNNAVLLPARDAGHYSWSAIIRNWALVWTGNLIGALAFVYIFIYGAGTLDAEPYRSAAQTIAVNKTSLPPAVIFIRGIGANWCVCLAVWLTLGVKSVGVKSLCVWIPVAAFVIMGFEHCIANMFFIPAGMLAGADITARAVAVNMLFSTIGNIVGGSLLVGMLYTRLYR